MFRVPNHGDVTNRREVVLDRLDVGGGGLAASKKPHFEHFYGYYLKIVRKSAGRILGFF